MEQIDLAAVHSAVRQWWRSGDLWDAAAAKVLVGEIEDGRWYVRRYGGGPGARYRVRRREGRVVRAEDRRTLDADHRRRVGGCAKGLVFK